jgi:hypothetical protein
MAGINMTPIPLSPQPGRGADLSGYSTASGRTAAAPRQAGKSLLYPSLTPEQQAALQRLQQVDREVRQHEQAHLAVAGGYARGGANYSYTTGPDGRQYATGGEVSIDVSPAATAEATIQKMEIVKRAAVAPANPSGQDRAVYATASKVEMQAEQERAQEQQAETSGEPAGRLEKNTFLSIVENLAPPTRNAIDFRA